MEIPEPRFNISSFILGMAAMAVLIAGIMIWRDNFSGSAGIGSTNCVKDMCLSYQVTEELHCYKLFYRDNEESVAFNQCFTNE